jgi:hypothetical protein
MGAHNCFQSVLSFDGCDFGGLRITPEFLTLAAEAELQPNLESCGFDSGCYPAVHRLPT